MNFTPVASLSRGGRVARSALVITLLLGGLAPSIGGINIVLFAGLASIPIVMYEIFRFVPKVHKVSFFVMPVFGLLLVHMLYIGPVTDYGVEKMSKILTVTMLTALSASLLRDRESIITLAKTWVAGALILAVFAIAGNSGDGRIDGFADSPIWLGRALATGIIAAVWLTWERRANRLLMVLAIATLAAATFSTGSRGPLLAAVVGIAVLTLGSAGKRVARIATVAAAGAVAVVALHVLPLFDNNRITVGADLSQSDELRRLFWSLSLPVVAANPAGVGVGNWAPAAQPPRQFFWPHNIFLEMFVEFGVAYGVAFIALVAFVLILLITKARKDRVALFVLAALTAEVSSVSVSGDLIARTFWFFLTLGCLVGVNQIRDLPQMAPRGAEHLRPSKTASSFR